MRFLGQPPRWHLQGEVTSSFKHRIEGIRVKHFVKFNSVKVHDKFGNVLLKTTINDPMPFKILRTKTGDPNGPKSRLPIRRSIADLYHRAQASLTVNNLNANALASINVTDELSTLFAVRE